MGLWRGMPAGVGGLVLAAAVLAGDATALIRDGEARLKSGDIDAGLARFRQAAEVDPGSALAHTRWGGALLLRQEYRASIAQFRAALKIDPDNADAFVGLAIAYLHGGNPALARAALAEAKRSDPARQTAIDALIDSIDRRRPPAGPAPAHP